jgi:hypothetical protein
MPMELIETKILPDAIQMRYADNTDPAQATEWCDFRISFFGLMHPLVQGKPQPLGPPESNFVAEVQLAALRRVRDVIGAETQRLSELIGRIR